MIVTIITNSFLIKITSLTVSMCTTAFAQLGQFLWQLLHTQASAAHPSSLYQILGQVLLHLLYTLCKEPCVASVEPVSPSLQQRYCLQVHLKGFALDIQGLPFSSGVIGFSRYREKQQHFPAYSFSSILGLVVRLVSPSLQQRGSLFLKSSWLHI